MMKELNPDVECDGDYCFIMYSDEGYQEKNIELTYYQAVKKEGVSSGEIGFRTFDAVKAVCVEHVGPYSKLGDAYAFVMKYIRENGLRIRDAPRECYIHGCWDRDSENDYLTEIQVPVE